MNNSFKYCIFIMGLVGSNYPMKADVLPVAQSFFCNTNLKSNTMEVFKTIPNYPNYEVSNFGNVKSLNYSNTKKPKLLKPYTNDLGYPYVVLCKNGKRKLFKIHQLVAMAFLGHKPSGNKIVVNHKDFNKSNNNVENLELLSNRENSSYREKQGSSKYTGVSWHNRDKCWRSQIVIDKKKIHLGSFKSEYEAHLAYQNKLKEIIN